MSLLLRTDRKYFQPVLIVASPAFQPVLEKQRRYLMASFSISLLLRFRDEMAEVPYPLPGQAGTQTFEELDIIAVTFKVAIFAAPIGFNDQQLIAMLIYSVFVGVSGPLRGIQCSARPDFTEQSRSDEFKRRQFYTEFTIA